MAEDEGEKYVGVFSKWQLNKQVKAFWEEYSDVQQQFDLLKEMDAHPHPSLPPTLAFREAAVQNCSPPPAEPTDLVIAMGIWPTTWLKFYCHQLAMIKEHLGNLKDDM